MTRSLRIRLDSVEDRGRAVLWNEGGTVSGRPLDISMTGMFVETPLAAVSTTGDVLVTVTIPGLVKSFTGDAAIVRRNVDSRFPLGLGLRWKEAPEALLEMFESWEATPAPEADDRFLLNDAQRSLRFLIVDHDQEFHASLVEYAAGHGIKLDAVPSLGLLPSLAAINEYAVLLVSYDLEPTSGLEVAEMLHRYLPDKPVVMLSETGRPWQSSLPDLSNVVGFADKWKGPRHVLRRLFTAAG